MAKGKVETTGDVNAPATEVVEMVHIERTGEVTYTGITVPRSDGSVDQWSPDEGTQAFVVDVETAVAAVKTGGFKVSDNSPVKLKEGG